MTGFPAPFADLRRWRTARSLADLAELTALWLEGKIGTQPHYGHRPADETTPLVPVLAGLCRAGYMTAASQPGLPRDARGFEQRAAVHGFAAPSVALQVADAALAAGMDVITAPPGRCPGPGGALVVSRRGPVPVSSLGPLPARVISSATTGWGVCHRDAVAALRGAWQVTVADPVWGRPGPLWESLQAALGPRAAEPG